MNADQFHYPYMPFIRRARLIISNDALVTLSDLSMAALKTELERLLSALSVTDNLFNKILSEAPVKLKPGTISDNVTAIKELKKQTASEDNQKAIQTFEADLRDDLKKCKKEVEDYRDSLFRQVSNLRTLKISDTTLELSYLEKLHKELVEGLPADKAELTSLRDEKKDLDKAVREFQSKTFIDRLKPIFEELNKAFESASEKTDDSNSSAEQGKALPTAPSFPIPDTAKQMVRGGVSVASKVLDILNEDIKYNHLLEARKKLKNQIDGLQVNMSDLQRRVDEIDDKKDQLLTLLEVVEPRKNYVDEADKIVNTFTEFLDEVFPDNTDLNKQDDLLKVGVQLAKSYQQFKKYLSDVQFLWLRSDA